MDILIGKWATAIRQTVARLSQVLGHVPHVHGPPVVNFTPTYGKNIFTYAHPTSGSIVAIDGGVFVFGSDASTDYSVKILEIHLALGALSTVNIVIADSDGRYERHLYTATGADNVRLLPVDAFVLPGQQLIITETVSGTPAVGVNKQMTVYAIQEGNV